MTAKSTSTHDIKLIVLDVDNTLLNSKHEISERNAEMIRKAKEKGVKVMLATGKNFGACKPIISQLDLEMPSICTQGLTIHEPDGSVRHQRTLDSSVARQVITFAEDRGFAVVAYAQGRVLARSRNAYVEELHTRWKEVEPEYVGPLQNLLNTIEFNKLVLVSAGDAQKIKGLRWQLSTQLNGNARLMSGGVSHMLEVLPPGASKGNALSALLKELKIKPENVLAIGDAENDIEMIQLAGIGLAVANGEKILKDAADEVIASNDDDAIADAITKYLFDETMDESQSDTKEASSKEDSEEETKASEEQS